jgi:hypothetical protein
MCVGDRLQRRRMGRWKDSVLRVTRRRKKRYWRPREWDWRISALVGVSCGGDVDVVVLFCRWWVCGEDVDMGRGSFSMRDQVR